MEGIYMFEIYDNELIRARLLKTIVRIDEKYVYINHISFDRDGRVIIFTLNDDEFYLDEKSISYDEMKSGLFQTPSLEMFWSARMPVRKWKVGFHHKNIVFSRLEPRPKVIYYDRDFFGLVLPPFLDMLNNNNIPPLDYVLGEGTGVLSKHFALRSGLLYRKTKCVGVLKGSKLELVPRFSFYQEQMEEEINVS